MRLAEVRNLTLLRLKNTQGDQKSQFFDQDMSNFCRSNNAMPRYIFEFIRWCAEPIGNCIHWREFNQMNVLSEYYIPQHTHTHTMSFSDIGRLKRQITIFICFATQYYTHRLCAQRRRYAWHKKNCTLCDGIERQFADTQLTSKATLAFCTIKQNVAQ